MLKQEYADRLTHPIRMNSKLRDATGLHKSIFEHAPESTGAQDYLALADFVINYGENNDGFHARDKSNGHLQADENVIKAGVLQRKLAAAG